MIRYEEAIAKHEPFSEYERGLIDGIRRFSWMKEGTTYVGTTGRTLGDAVDRAITEHRAGEPPV
jgi:hypothetical protein